MQKRTETVYKVTRPDLTTYGGFKWKVGRTYRFPGHGDLCTEAYAHAYRTPELAVLMHRAYGARDEPFLLWRGPAIVERDDGFKLGCTALQLNTRVPIPKLSVEQRVEFAIRVASLVCRDSRWLRWARRRLRKGHGGLATDAAYFATNAAYSALAGHDDAAADAVYYAAVTAAAIVSASNTTSAIRKTFAARVRRIARDVARRKHHTRCLAAKGARK